MKINVDESNFRGIGKLLFAVVFIDSDDHEDSSTEFWLADDEDSLYNQIEKQWLGLDQDEEIEADDDDGGGFGAPRFDDAWGFEILFTEIGTKDE